MFVMFFPASLQAAKKLEEEQQFRRNVEERAREKREEARAREKIRAKLGAPRRTLSHS